MRKFMSRVLPGGVALAIVSLAAAAASPPLYENDFQSDEIGKPPAGMLVLGGGFAVRADGDQKFLELPGTPLEDYGVLFGPAQTNDVAVTARIFGTGKGRRYPAFGVGLGGVNGFKLRVSPGKKALELHKGDTEVQRVPFDWQSGQWTRFHLQLRESPAGESVVEGKAWTEGTPEPAEWLILHIERTPPRPGRAALWGAPYADTPIRYDDLRLTRAVPTP